MSMPTGVGCDHRSSKTRERARNVICIGPGSALAATCLAVLVLAGAASVCATGNGAWQWQNPLSQGGSYAGGWFLDAAHGWLISGGDIFHTSNGGETLTVPASHNVTFTDITFVDAGHGGAVGAIAGDAGTNATVILATRDGGGAWTRQLDYVPPMTGNTSDGRAHQCRLQRRPARRSGRLRRQRRGDLSHRERGSHADQVRAAVPPGRRSGP